MSGHAVASVVSERSIERRGILRTTSMLAPALGTCTCGATFREDGTHWAQKAVESHIAEQAMLQGERQAHESAWQRVHPQALKAFHDFTCLDGAHIRCREAIAAVIDAREG